MDGGAYLKLVIFGDELLSNRDSAGELLAKRLGIEYDNRAEVDTSNSRIHKNIVKYLIDNDTANTIMLIGWTSPYRLDAEYDSQYFTYRPDKHDYPNLKMNKLHNYDNYIFDSIVINQRWASIVYGVQQLANARQCKYYMFNTQHHLQYSTYTEHTIRNFNSKLYFDAINTKNTMREYLIGLGYKDILSNSACDEYARFLAQKLRQQDLIQRA